MNTYIEKNIKEAEGKIVGIIRDLEESDEIEVTAVNFVRQAMCDKDEQKIKTWDIKLSCRAE